jgi:hypothetical protein
MTVSDNFRKTLEYDFEAVDDGSLHRCEQQSAAIQSIRERSSTRDAVPQKRHA